MEEIWKEIPGLNGKYECSNKGRVRRVNKDPRCEKYKILNLQNTKDGYMSVNPTIKFRRRVHRLVAEVFIPNPENKSQVNHIDGNKSNNHVTNLEWVTPAENMQHAIDTGLRSIGADITHSKLTEEDVIEIINLFDNGIIDSEIAKEFNVTAGVISSIRFGKTWKHVTKGRTWTESLGEPHKKLTADNIPIIRKMITEGFSDADIGRVFDVARGTINQIRQGKTWKNY